MSTPSARTGGSLDAWFKISQRGSTVRQEVVAGLTTFLAMVYSVIVVPGMLGKAGFPPAAVFVATCLVAGLGSIVMGLWANLPLAIGCAISLTAFTAFSLVLGQHISVPVALGAVFLMGVLFTVISATGKIHRNKHINHRSRPCQYPFNILCISMDSLLPGVETHGLMW